LHFGLIRSEELRLTPDGAVAGMEDTGAVLCATAADEDGALCAVVEELDGAL